MRNQVSLFRNKGGSTMIGPDGTPHIGPPELAGADMRTASGRERTESYLSNLVAGMSRAPVCPCESCGKKYPATEITAETRQCRTCFDAPGSARSVSVPNTDHAHTTACASGKDGAG